MKENLRPFQKTINNHIKIVSKARNLGLMDDVEWEIWSWAVELMIAKLNRHYKREHLHKVRKALNLKSKTNQN
jgi:hypothetical protein